MPRIIDAEKIALTASSLVDEDGCVYVTLEDVRKAIAQTPTAAVLCQDCESYRPVSKKCGNCHYTTSIMHPTDFCSRGKRKEQA